MPTRSGASSSSMASFSSSWLDGSPSRQSPHRTDVRTPRGSLVLDPYDSPSRQIQIEFNMMLEKSDRDFNERLDTAAAERAKIHNDQLTKAAQAHQRVQEGAKLELQRLLLEQEQEQRRREEAQRREIERLNQEKARQEAEAQRQRLDARRREEEAARQAAERQRQIQEADARAKAQREQEEAARRQKEEAERKAREAAEKAKAQPQPPPAPQVAPTPAVPAPSAATSSPPSGVEELHTKYLALHARMKQFRTNFADKHKQKGNPLKESVGDARRSMRKRLGQVTIERSDSIAAIKAIRLECFDKALQTPGPFIDIRPFITSQPIPPLADEAEAQYPAFLLYVWICFEKSVIKQWHSEAANEDGRIIQELGLIAASLYADQKYMWKGIIPLTDTILAKLHRICPILFGIRGNTNTKEGLARLGLDKFGGGENNQNSYGQLMSGLGAGYAALSLRQFSGKNPAIPMSEYWRAVVSICNTPSNALYPGHFMCLKGLLKDYVKKFLAFYGAPARAVLRRATVDLPSRAPKERPGLASAAELVKVLPDTWRVSLNLLL